MRIVDLHRTSPVELRFTIIDGNRVTVRFLFVKDTAPASEVAGAMVDNLNHYADLRDAGFPHDYDSAKHVAGILADAARYGTD